MLMTKVSLGLLLLALGMFLLWFLNRAIDRALPYVRSAIELILTKLPERAQRSIARLAQCWGSNGDTVHFVMEQGIIFLILVMSLLLPLPNWVSWSVSCFIIFTIVQRRSQRRLLVRRFEKQWPNCLDMLAMLMRSGLSFAAALHALAQLPSSSVAIRQLRQLQQQLHAGVAMEEAFAALKERLPSPAFTSFAAAVMQARLSGSALTTTLMLQAQQARKEQQLAAEKFAQEVGVKLLLPLVTCFFPVTFLLILGPIFIGYLHS